MAIMDIRGHSYMGFKGIKTRGYKDIKGSGCRSWCHWVLGSWLNQGALGSNLKFAT